VVDASAIPEVLLNTSAASLIARRFLGPSGKHCTLRICWASRSPRCCGDIIWLSRDVVYNPPHKWRTRADVYYPAGTALDPAYRQIDRFIAEAEVDHRLAMQKRVTVVECRNWDDFGRFMPLIRGRTVGAVTLATGSVIYVTPRLAEKHYDTAEFLRHELSHALIHQNTPLVRGWRMERQAWFFEGLAVAFGWQKSYLSEQEFIERAATADLTRFIGPPSNELPQPPDMRFCYPAWRYFLEYLMRTRGRDAFQFLLAGFMENPDAVRATFAHVYGESLAQAAARFQREVRSGRWKAQ
jgi:hypothetical protein